jgi:hypothetical protein
MTSPGRSCAEQRRARVSLPMIAAGPFRAPRLVSRETNGLSKENGAGVEMNRTGIFSGSAVLAVATACERGAGPEPRQEPSRSGGGRASARTCVRRVGRQHPPHVTRRAPQPSARYDGKELSCAG